MPIYVYKNLKTGERFEIEQRITEPPLAEHPETGDPVKRLIQPVGIAFKGSGFYATDSRAASRTPSAPNAGAEAGATDASAATSSDSSKSDSSKSEGAKSAGAKEGKSEGGSSDRGKGAPKGPSTSSAAGKDS